MFLLWANDGESKNGSLGVQECKGRVLFELKQFQVKVFFVQVDGPTEHFVFSCIVSGVPLRRLDFIRSRHSALLYTYF